MEAVITAQSLDWRKYISSVTVNNFMPTVLDVYIRTIIGYVN